MMVRVGFAAIGLSVFLGSVAGVAQAAAGAQAAPATLTLSTSSVSASRTIRVDAVQLRPDTTYELISNKTRPNPSSTEVGGSEQVTVLARVKANSIGQFSRRFVVPLDWRHDHLIEVQKVKGADLVAQANDWLTVTAPRPALALSTDKVQAGSQFRVVVSGLRAHTKYVVFNNRTRTNAQDPTIVLSSDPGALHSVRTDANGRALVMITAPDHWAHDHLIEVEKAKGLTRAAGANAWLTVLR